MNFFDIIMICINLIIFLGGIVAIISAIRNCVDFIDGILLITPIIFCISFILMFTLGKSFVVLDKASGSSIGTITSVDKNFFGTTALYIKTTENSQEKYCIENTDIANKAKEMIGKQVKITYGSRVGLYSTGKCHQAPIENIEVFDN